MQDYFKFQANLHHKVKLSKIEAVLLVVVLMVFKGLVMLSKQSSGEQGEVTPSMVKLLNVSSFPASYSYM